MDDVPDIASIAALIGDPARARMLMALMDGRALTATELAVEGGVTASTTSSHLARLTAARLVTLARQGRHRYFRIAQPEIADVLESLMAVASRRRPRVGVGPRDEELRRARVCYDHLAGERGVRLLERLRERGFIRGRDGEMTLTREGEAWVEALGIDVAALRATRRPLCRSCLDWSERRLHLAGALGAALLNRLFALRYAEREPVGRAVIVSSRGAAFL